MMAYNYVSLLLLHYLIITATTLKYPSLTKMLVGFVCMCSGSNTGNSQLPHNIPGGYLVHVLFSRFFPINGPGRFLGKPR